MKPALVTNREIKMRLSPYLKSSGSTFIPEMNRVEAFLFFMV
ncbi:hypothetical protein STRPS_1150 [Streptococcus pseudoporcinus LQ 940-04]|uniref:Uncharacterized protein n=1 Tax=Streptococcus pseudoporcinus LQ 940-04 TaxID=875093 RepID=G5K877_9STRE|nr:hypothetical protein HMPREF9320_0998 [Streptococcus pseudoporcinus SPIN 20026]EHI64367.1 hypothetical protein STRPS_1150 [Streptococcus pseudoporcinus LQ 940-04]